MELRMEAYYYSFEPTGVPEIDLILSAVACAGKAYHCTEAWEDETSPYLGHEGKNPIEWIQNAANKAAKIYNQSLVCRYLGRNKMTDLEYFQKELSDLINRYSLENYCDIPDFLLAELITSIIINSGFFIKKVLDWHGCDSVCHPKPDNQSLLKKKGKEPLNGK